MVTEHALLPLALGLAASGATLAGGWLAWRFQQRITLVLGLAAGVVLGIALFELIPEALAMAAGRYDPHATLGCVALGFGFYLLLDRGLGAARSGLAAWRAHLGPASLTLHSFTDGLGIGLAFQVSADIGWMVALVVLIHDVADGINTVSLSLAGTRPEAARHWLLANGLAPLLGVTAGLLLHVPAPALALLLAVFAGAFLFIGACELLPRSHARDPRLRVTLASVAGLLLMLLVTRWSH